MIWDVKVHQIPKWRARHVTVSPRPIRPHVTPAAARVQDGGVPSTFTLVTETPYPVEALFDLSLDIDAHLASMSQSAERAVAGPW